MPNGNMPPQMPGAQAPQQEGGATQLVSSVNDNLMKLMDLMDKSPAVEPADKENLASLISGFQSFVEGLGQPAGQAKPPQGPPQASGPVPAMAGAGDVKPAM